MTCVSHTPTGTGRDLHFTRLINGSRDKVYRAWTEPELLKQWFCPLPWKVSEAVLDVRPGGSSFIVMQGPEGQSFPSRGVYLEVVENERIVFTDAFAEAWTPSDKPFMTAIVALSDEEGKTRYSAHVRHWTEADREEHERMGFHPGWAKAADQLEALVASL